MHAADNQDVPESEARPDGRINKRYEINVSAKLSADVEPSELDARVSNMGIGGVQLKLADQVNVGRDFRLELFSESGHTLASQGKIVYCRPEGEIFVAGFQFCPQSLEERLQITNFLYAELRRCYGLKVALAA